MPRSLTKKKNFPSEKDFTVVKLVNKDKYSKSYLVREKRTNFICILKQINKESTRRHNIVDRVALEIRTHRRLSHPNIIELYGFFETETDVFLILESGDQQTFA